MSCHVFTQIGVTHSSDYCMWKKNEYASNGVRDFAEKGEAWALMKEIEEAGEKIQSVHGIFSAPAISSGTGQTSTELEAHPRHPLVSKCTYSFQKFILCYQQPKLNIWVVTCRKNIVKKSS